MDAITAVRTLIGDTLSVSFTDDQITLFLTQAGIDISPITNPYSSGTNDADFGVITEYFFAAALALRALAASKSTNLQEVRIGDFMDSSGRNQIAALNATADAYMKVYYETPAWAIAETDESDMNALITIRNFVLRTNP